MRHTYGLLLVMLAAFAVPASAQTLPGVDPGSTVRTRAELEQALAQYEAALTSTEFSQSVRANIRADAEQIRARLANGDFRVGDRIAFSVEGEPNLPDTLTVQPGQVVSLPLFGDVSVAGVLRSEITEHLSEALSRFIRDPVVRANGLMRVSVMGQVGQPGFYTMPAETVLGDALMLAGGPSGAANVGKVRIERGPTRLHEGDELQEALRQGLTLDQLNMQAGDQIFVPQRGAVLRNIGLVTGIVASLSWALFRFF